MGSLTVPEKILIAAFEINGADKAFTAEDLTVAAWKKYPDTFGLQGYETQYPDSNRILTNIMGSKGLRGKRWIRKVGEKKYKITETGREAAQNAIFPLSVENKSARTVGISREGKEILKRLLHSKALLKHEQNQSDLLTFTDACSFWNISVRSTSTILQTRIADLESTIAIAQDYIQTNKLDSLVLTHGEEELTRANLETIENLHAFLLAKFSKELDIIRSRQDERRFS